MSLQSSQLTARQPDGASPRAVLAELGLSDQDLRHEVVHHLVSALQHASSLSRTPERSFVDQVRSALRVYLSSCAQNGGLRHLPRGSLPAWKERRVKELMQSQLSCKLSLERLAKECDLSVRHFTRAFALSTGSSPRRYLLQLRLERARQLLMDAELPLNEVAMACGFADQSHFTRAFSAAQGMSPGAWRRNLSPRQADFQVSPHSASRHP